MKLGKSGAMLSSYARGEDNSPVESSSKADAKSIGNGFTFKHDLVGREECLTGIKYLSEEIGTKLRIKGLKCSTVQLTIKDEYLRSIQRNLTLSSPTDISSEIADAAYRILCREWKEERPIRMITVTATNIVRADSVHEQLGFFDSEKTEKREKNGKREIAVDEIRRKFGTDSIVRASIIENDIGIYNKKNKKK